MSRTDSSGQGGLTWEPDPDAPGHTHETGGAWYALRWRVGGCPACNPATPTEETAEVADEDRDALTVLLAMHRCVVSGDVDGWHVICHCGHQARGVDATAHIADAILASDWLRDRDNFDTRTCRSTDHDANASPYRTGDIRAERNDLRARLAKVETLAGEWGERAAYLDRVFDHIGAQGHRAAASSLRAALANPDAAGEGK